jgi:hypothetical protein
MVSFFLIALPSPSEAAGYLIGQFFSHRLAFSFVGGIDDPAAAQLNLRSPLT